VAEKHDTPSRTVLFVPLTVAWIPQPCPFQCSASEKQRLELQLDPTAVQEAADVHEIRLRIDSPPPGFGVVCSLQDDPFHCSTSVTVSPEKVSVVLPTAVHEVAEVHDTPLKTELMLPPRFGVPCVTHFDPFQRSATVKFRSAELPTAVHALAEVHDTPLKTEPSYGFGEVWIVQRDPFHRSASVASSPPVAFPVDPTAVHTVAEMHDTSLNTESVLAPFGVVWIVHEDPFQRSASVLYTLLAFPTDPTAVHAVGEVHDTSPRYDWVDPTGEGADWMAHLDPFHCSTNISGTPPVGPS